MEYILKTYFIIKESNYKIMLKQIFYNKPILVSLQKIKGDEFIFIQNIFHDI